MNGFAHGASPTSPVRQACVLCACACAVIAAGIAIAAGPASAPASKTLIVVFDFVGNDSEPTRSLADAIRMRLARHGDEFVVIDRLTTQELAPHAMGHSADRSRIAALMKDEFSATLALTCTVTKTGDTVKAQVRCIDLTGGKDWTQTFTDSTERFRAVIATAVVEKLTGRAQWRPRERGEEPEPNIFAKPQNVNGDFSQGARGWARPDNVSTFIEAGPEGRGNVLRMRNDLARDPWLEYRRNIMLGRSDPNRPPEIAVDESMGGLAGLEGCDFVSDFFPATPGQRYWLTADTKGPTGAMIFIKGWKPTSAATDGLSETSLAEMRMTPEQFAGLPSKKRADMIASDARRHPLRYLREVYRWRLTCPGGSDWTHVAEPFPPRGGMMKDVKYLQVKVLTIWPPGTQLWDNIHVYKDPAQKASLPEERPRTPGGP